ncbi:hypothetical protein SAMN04489761_1829 [Tenacibaculum sp. MAR_2009_124]|uniref:hypothetical protein n=1 Tax=Tenacibaculum sp. MAR_2009_124 TaxID=1250059 RepID=UPI00089B7012|nr:hypothetical protein [Tenacibaculum sp. MAR_2009_124]SEB80761.1 hypothetical protein SAMN04489761_1829 [Tenacibaculum sp. MAR_2009_124]
MKTLKNTAIITLFLSLFMMSPAMFSQEVVVEDNVEYIADSDSIEDENSLNSVLLKKTTAKKRKNKTIKKKKSRSRRITAKEAEEMLRHGNLRFRKKRTSTKCFIEKESEEKCDSKEEKNAQ